MHQQFFMMPEEFLDFVESVLLLEEISVYRNGWTSSSRLERVSQMRSSFADIKDQHFLKRGPPTPPKALPKPPTVFAPAELGWVQLTTPKIVDEVTRPKAVDDGILLLAEVATKWKWYDLDSDSVKENADAKRTFQFIKRRLRRILKTGGVFLVDRASRGEREVKGIAWSSGAREWSASGRELAQRGVPNSVFEIR